MSVGVRLGPVFASCRPTRFLSGGIVGLLMLPLYIIPLVVMALAVVVWALAAVVWVVAFAIKGLARLIPVVGAGVWWLLAFPFRLLIVWPVRAWRRWRRSRRVSDAFAQAPTGPRVAA